MAEKNKLILTPNGPMRVAESKAESVINQIAEEAKKKRELAAAGKTPRTASELKTMARTVAQAKQDEEYTLREQAAARGENRQPISVMGKWHAWDMEEADRKLTSASDRLKKSQKNTSFSGTLLKMAKNNYQKNPTAKNRAIFERAYKGYDEKLKAFEADRKEYEKEYVAYGKTFDTYKKYALGEDAAWKKWESGLRADAEIIKKELQEARRERAYKGQQYSENADMVRAYERALPYGQNLETWANVNYARNNIEKLNMNSARDIAAHRYLLKENLGRDIESLDKKIEALEAELYHAQTTAYTKRPDFEEQSAYKTKKNEREVSFVPGTNMPKGDMWEGDWGFDDIKYDYINKDPDAISRVRAYERATGAKEAGYDWEFLRTMSDEEIGVYNYMYAVNGKESAEKYLDDLKSNLQARETARQMQNWKELGNEHKIIGSIASAAMAAEKVRAGAINAISYLGTGEIDENAGYNDIIRASGAIREGVSQDMGKVGSFVYNTSMSLADNVARLALSGGSAGVAQSIMFGGVFADAVVSAKDRGLSDNQAFALGIATAGIEALTEKMPLDAILDGKTLKESAKRYVLKGALSEAGEELASNALTTWADVIISKDKSEWKQSIAAYEAQGLGAKEALGKAFRDQALSAGVDSLAGLLSGAAMSGGVAIANELYGVHQDRKTTKETVNFIEQRKKREAEGLSGVENISRSIETIPNTKMKYVKADRQVIKGDDPSQWAEDVKDYIDTEIRNGKDVPVIAEDGDVLYITKDTSGKARFRNAVLRPDGSKTLMTDEEYAVKLRAEAHIDEVAEASKRGNKTVPDTKDHTFAKDGFNYRTAYFEDLDGKYYRLTISVGKNGEINTVYNVGKIKEAQLPLVAQRPGTKGAEEHYASGEEQLPLSGSKAVRKNAGGHHASTNNIPQSEQKNNPLAQNTQKSFYSSGVELPTAQTKGERFMPTAAEMARQNRAKNAKTETERSGILHGVDDDTIRFAENMGKKTGRTVLFYEGESEEGYYDRDTGKVYVNTKNTKGTRWAIAHEVTHSIEGTEAYNSLLYRVTRKLRSEGTDMAAELEVIQARYKSYGLELGRGAAAVEVVANYVADHLMTDALAIAEMTRTDPETAGKIRSFLDSMAATFGNRNTKERIFIERARSLYAQALNETRAMTGEATKAEPGAEAKTEHKAEQSAKTADNPSGSASHLPLHKGGAEDGSASRHRSSDGEGAREAAKDKARRMEAEETQERYIAENREAVKAAQENAAREYAREDMTAEEYDETMDILDAERSMAGESMLYDDGRQYSIEKEKGVANKGEKRYNKETRRKQSGVMWTLQKGVMTNDEVAAFYEKISEMRSQKYKNYVISAEGDFIFEVGNKLVYSDGNYRNPHIENVIEFNTKQETVITEARRLVYECETNGTGTDFAYTIIETVYGQEFIKQTNYGNSETYGEFVGRGEGENGKATDSRSREDGGWSQEEKQYAITKDIDETDNMAAEKETPKALLSQREVAEIYAEVKRTRRNLEKVQRRMRLSDEDKMHVGRLLRGELTAEYLPEDSDKEGVLAVYEAKREYENYAKQIRKWNERRKEGLRAKAREYLGDMQKWKDKTKFGGLRYSVETMERNFRDVMGGDADALIAEYITPVHKAQAESTKLKNEMRDRVRALNLSRKVADGNLASEAHAVQLLGEAEDNIAVLKAMPQDAKRDGKTLSEWEGTVAKLWAQNPKLNEAKIRGAVQTFREIYDSLFAQMNETRVRNGYEPVNYRRGYFPHFQPGDEGVLAQFGRILGIDTSVSALPTTINGMTHIFRPGIQWLGNTQQRIGFSTVYDAVEGFDKYIEGVADVIYQTDNIQNLRALAREIRYAASDEGIKKQVDQIEKREDLTREEKDALILELYKDGKFALGNFVVELDEYTNLLANKKSRADREMERKLGREFYNVARRINSNIAANMTSLNIPSWLTNFIPLTQAWGLTDSRYLLSGMWDTLKAIKHGDDFVGRSTFLTNRRGADPIVQIWEQGEEAKTWFGKGWRGYQAAVDKLSGGMELIDNFTSEAIVRAKYYQNIKEGMSEQAAMDDADAFAAGVMADRSKGAMPTAFYETNPVKKLFTQFQIEVNNQYRYVFKDVPHALKGQGAMALAMALTKILVGAFLFNELYELLFGRRSATDPLGVLNDAAGDFVGYQVPSLLDAARGDISFREEDPSMWKGVSNLTTNIGEELPFVGGVVFGGGRVPLSSAMPDVQNLGKAIFNGDWSGKKRLATLGKEIAKPLSYAVLPGGGSQIKKSVEGAAAIIRGGSYTTDANGNDILQYPVYNDRWDAPITGARAILFGKSTLPTAKEWVDSEFDSLSAKDTETYRALLDAGVAEEDAFDAVQAVRKANKSNDKRDAIRISGLSDEGKKALYRAKISDTKDDEIAELEGVGIGFDDFLRIHNEYTTINGQFEGEGATGKKAMAFSRWVNAQPWNKEQKDAVRDSFVYYNQIPAEAGRYDKLMDAGLTDEKAANLAGALDALEPEQGQDKVSDLQRYRAVATAALTDKERMAALSTMMGESEYKKLDIGSRQGVTPIMYVTFKEKLLEYDADKNGTFKQEEVTMAIRAMTGTGLNLPKHDGTSFNLTNKQRAALWQMANSSWKPNKNPFDTSVGTQVYNALKKK